MRKDFIIFLDNLFLLIKHSLLYNIQYQLGNPALPRVFRKSQPSQFRNLKPSWEPSFCSPGFHNQNLRQIDQRLLFIFIYIYFSCLPFCLGLCLFVSKKRQNGWTDGAQIFCCGTSGDPKEGFWMIKFSKIKLNRLLISDLLVLGCFGIYCSFSAYLHSNIR